MSSRAVRPPTESSSIAAMLRGAASGRTCGATSSRKGGASQLNRSAAVDPSGSLTPRAVDLATLRKTTGAPLRDLLNLDIGERTQQRPGACCRQGRAPPARRPDVAS